MSTQNPDNNVTDKQLVAAIDEWVTSKSSETDNKNSVIEGVNKTVITETDIDAWVKSKK